MSDKPTTAPQWMDVAKDSRGGWSTFAAHEGNSTRYVPEARLAEKDAEIARMRSALGVYASICEGTKTKSCGYTGNMCCATARAALSPDTDSEGGS